MTRAQVVAAATAPGILAVMSLDDTIAAAKGPEMVVRIMRMSRAALAMVHGEPTPMDVARWQTLDADEKRECLEASKRGLPR